MKSEQLDIFLLIKLWINTEYFSFFIYQKKMTGASRVAAKLKAAWASPSLAAPSPK